MEIVVNKKESNQILYKITNKTEDEYELSGINYRIIRRVKKNNVEKAPEMLFLKEKACNDEYLLCIKNENARSEVLLGTVLHVDTDKEYLDRCLSLYNNVGIYAFPLLTTEKQMEFDISNVNFDFHPDVIVLTGHDYFKGDNKKDINDYVNSKYFATAVLSARKKYPNSVIIAGACQSLFEVLIAKGANFASSPKRENIHIYDPAIMAINVCITSQKKIVNLEKIKKHIENIESSFGGVETYGKMKVMY